MTLTDDDAGSARFQVASMTPGDSDTKCIKVTANATVPGTVRGYVVNPVLSPQKLEERIMITLKAGTGGDFSSCTGFVPTETIIPSAPLSQLAAANSYDAGVGGWAVSTGTQSRTYQITWTFDTTGMSQAAVDQLQGSHTGMDLQWELQTS